MHLLAKRSILKIEIRVYNFSMLALVLELDFLNQTKLTKRALYIDTSPKYFIYIDLSFDKTFFRGMASNQVISYDIYSLLNTFFYSQFLGTF